jgi:enoyl-CoA hydratase/carnithine racemase
MTDFSSGTDQVLVSLDHRVATITLNRPEARNALSPELSSGLRRAIAWLLTRIVGPGRARKLLLTSERVGAEAALEIGLVNEVVAADELSASALEMTRKLARGPSIAYAYLKDNLDEARSIDHATAIDREADRLLKARTTSDHREAVRALAEKRPPEFTGR